MQSDPATRCRCVRQVDMESVSSENQTCVNVVPIRQSSYYKGSSGHHCVVVGCQNNQRKRNRLLRDVCEKHDTLRESCRCGIYKLHRFPRNAELRRQWIAAVNRKDYNPSAHARVCSEHFVDRKPSQRNPVPMLHLGYVKEVVLGRRPLVRQAVSPVRQPSHCLAAHAQPSSDSSKQDEAESVEDSICMPDGGKPSAVFHVSIQQAPAAVGPRKKQLMVKDSHVQTGQTCQACGPWPAARDQGAGHIPFHGTEVRIEDGKLVLHPAIAILPPTDFQRDSSRLQPPADSVNKKAYKHSCAATESGSTEENHMCLMTEVCDSRNVHRCKCRCIVYNTDSPPPTLEHSKDWTLCKALCKRKYGFTGGELTDRTSVHSRHSVDGKITLEKPEPTPCCGHRDVVFEDALDVSSPRIETRPADAVNVERAAEEATRALDLLLSNQFGEALKRMKPKAHESMYHALGQSTIMFMQAVLTIDMSDIKSAQEAIRQGVEVCNRMRRRTSAVARMLLRPDYNTYTMEEIHAELCYAECLLENAILTFVEDQSLVTFIKGGLKIRSCYQSYKECMQMLATRNWESSKEKEHFESGVHLGVGAFNLLISQLPSRILKLLEFIGFSGNKVLGLRELEDGCMMQDYLRGPLCSIVLVAYHTFVLYILGLGDGDLELSERLVKGLLSKYPKGVLSLFFNARMHQVKGQIENAINQYYEAIEAQNEWIPFHYICYWELLWCHCFRCDWDRAIETADILRKGCRWSKATYVYIQASCLYAKYREGSTELMEEIANLLRQVPGLKQKIAGKSIPIEKFVVKKSQKFFDNGQRLTLPVVEIMYMWNSFPMIGRNEKLLLQILGLIENTLPVVSREKEMDERYVDDYCLAMLLKGVCMRYMGHPLQSEECFLEVFKYQDQILEDTYLLPFAAAELGFLSMQQQQYTKAKEWLDQARNNYRDYLLESLVHFRIHSALKSLRSGGHLSPRSDPTTPSPTNSPFPSPLNTPTHGVMVNGFPFLSTSPGITKKVMHPPIPNAGEEGIVGAD